MKLGNTCILLLASIVSCGAGEAAADCNPVDFMVADVQHVTMTDRLKTAFLLTASKEQYDKATQSGAASFAYGPVGGALSYDQAREAALKEAQSTGFTYDRQYYVDFISQQISPASADMYSACLLSDKQSSGLRIWYHQQKGDYVFLNAFWVGTDATQGVAKLASPPTVDQLKVVQVPTDWPKGQTQQIVVKRDPTVDGLISTEVGDQFQTYVVLKDPPITPMSTSAVAGPLVAVTSGGTSDGHSPWCQRRSISSCVVPKHPEGYLIVGSGDVSDVTTTGRSGHSIIKDTPQEMCVEFWASTGACETQVSIQGRATAVERFPVR